LGRRVGTSDHRTLSWKTIDKLGNLDIPKQLGPVGGKQVEEYIRHHRRRNGINEIQAAEFTGLRRFSFGYGLLLGTDNLGPPYNCDHRHRDRQLSQLSTFSRTRCSEKGAKKPEWNDKGKVVAVTTLPDHDGEVDEDKDE